MNLHQLDILLAVVAAGSFSAAARKLGKAQSAVSTAISELEIDLNLQLFDRSGRYPSLTEAGSRILQQAQLVRQQCQELKELATYLAGGLETQLRLAVDDEGQLPWLAPVLAELAAQFPKLELQLLFPLLEDLTKMLESGDADLGICFQPQQLPEQFLRWPLQQLQFAAAVSTQHPLAKLVEVTAADLQQHRQLMVTGAAKALKNNGAGSQIKSGGWKGTSPCWRWLNKTLAGPGCRCMYWNHNLPGALLSYCMSALNRHSCHYNWSFGNCAIKHLGRPDCGSGKGCCS